MKRTSKTPSPTETGQATSKETPPSDIPFAYRDYVEAQKNIEHAAQRGPFYGWVWGPTGTGKTSLMREVRQGFDRHRHQIIYLSATQVSTTGIARHLAQAMHVTPRRSSLETARLITQALRDQAAPVIAWLDEAHRLAPDTLAELNSLAEFDPDAPQVFSVIFSGPKELLTLLDDRRLVALKRRVTVRCHLAGLRRSELDPFLGHRFGSVDERRLPHDLRDELFERTQGAPAIVDVVVRIALQQTTEPVTAQTLKEVLDVHAS